MDPVQTERESSSEPLRTSVLVINTLGSLCLGRERNTQQENPLLNWGHQTGNAQQEVSTYNTETCDQKNFII